MNDRNAAMLDPRVVFAFVVYLSSAVVIQRQAVQLLPVFAIAVVSALLMRIDMKNVFYKLRRLWYVVVFVAVLQGIFMPSGTVLLRIGGVAVFTTGGILTGVAVLLRLATLIFGGSMIARYQSRVLIQGMIQLKVPYELAYMVSVGIRFIPLAAQSLRDSITAIQLRGVNFDKMRFKKRLRVYTYLLLPTIASGIHHAHELATAMELRGFRAYGKRSSFFTLRMKRRDYGFLWWVVALGAATVLANVLFFNRIAAS